MEQHNNTTGSNITEGSGCLHAPRAEFAVHVLNEQGLGLAFQIEQKFSGLLSFLEQPKICIQSRELSLAKTKLEEACFYAKKAMATNLVNQKQD